MSLKQMWKRLDILPDTTPQISCTAQHPAYIMYTSGSTGNPKGIVVSHQAVLRLVYDTNYIELGPDDCIAQLSNVSFDASTFEIWGALLSGARLAGVTREQLLSFERLSTRVTECGINTIFLTTALFNQLSRFQPEFFSVLKNVLFGGEAADPQWVSRVLNHGKPERLLHVYGPTEATTFSSWYLVEDVQEGISNIPIGRPLSNTDLYVLDAHGQPVPAGIPGELYIGGPGLATGYVSNPALTAEYFVPNPFDGQSDRLYRTGDRVRSRADGVIEFLGRLDSQIKLRGFRIEPSEIEACLCRHELVCDSLVLLREDKPGEQRLVAYVVNTENQLQSTNELRTYLKERLPGFMIPADIILLDSFPLNANGKIDRVALPAPKSVASEPHSASPATDTEKLIADVWRQLLDAEQVGRDDNFFDLGGHSLLMIQVQSRLSDLLDHDIPMLVLFSHPTIRTLAVHIAGRPVIAPQSDSPNERAMKRHQARRRKRQRIRESGE